MLYLLAAYWPFLLAAFFLGLLVGWWKQGPRGAANDLTAWLEREPDRQ